MNRNYILAMFLSAGLLAACGSQSAAPATTPVSASTTIPATGVKVEVEGGVHTNVTPQELNQYPAD